MARSEYEGAPQVSADTSAPDDYQHVQSSTENFGEGIVRGVTSAATDFNRIYTQTAADDATNQLQQYSNTILNGHPGQGTPGPDGQMIQDTGFLGKRGADAMQAAPQTLTDLDDKIKEIRESLPTREAQFQFDQESRRYRFNWQSQIASHAREQQYTWSKSVNTVSEQTALNTIGSAPENNDQFLQGVMSLRKAYKSQAALDGLDPSEAEMRADQTATLTRVHALLPTNPALAQQVFDANNKILAGLPNYDGLASQIKTGVINAQVGPAADQMVAGAQSAAQGMVGAPGKADIHSAIYAQESGSGANTKTSITGAVGPMQIQPETFKRFAKPGEDINNPADNRAVGNRIIDHYSQEYHGDAARVATAFFSGEGNVAPAGSPTPWIRDAVDPTGKKTSQYVSDVQQRMGGGQTYPSTADAIRANYAKTVQDAQDYAQRTWPQYPDAQERYLTHVERGLSRTITQQEQMHEVNVHIVQQSLLGPHAPTSEAELMSSSPQVAAAWNDMRVNTPMAAMSVERIFDANARGKAAGFGKQFNSMLMDRVLAPANDPHRVKAASDMWPYVAGGEDAPITNSGLGALSDILQQRGTPQGEAQASQLRSFFQKARKVLSDQDPNSGIYDPKGEERFTHFVMNALPNIKAEQDGGKPLAQILGDKGDIWNSVGIYDRTPTQRMHDRIMGHGNASTTDQSPEAQQAALATGFRHAYAVATTNEQRQTVIDDAKAQGFVFRPKQAPQGSNPNAPPEVPRPAQMSP
jgi:Transglycosylase SLT domain